MRFFHISDIHLGKRFKGVSFINDQKFILNQIISHIDILKPDCIVIAGDVYDKSIPSAEAVELLDEFLTELSARKLAVLIISGNHDSCERLQYAGGILEKNNIFIASIFKGEIKKVTLQDEYGDFDFYLVPYFRSSQVRSFYTESEINSSNDAMKVLLENTKIDHKNRNTLVIHQFVSPLGKNIDFSDSETQTAGGLDVIDAGLFKDFDYTAMGHIHKPQNMGSKIRYCGTPLKYSFSETLQEKSITVVEINEKGKTEVSLVPLKALHDMKIIKGPFEKLIESAKLSPSDDYINGVITGNEMIADSIGKLRQFYPNILQLEFIRENSEMKTNYNEDFISKSMYELFEDFFKMQNGKDLTDEQKKIVKNLLKEESLETT
jgi:exonuclease SbcD